MSKMIQPAVFRFAAVGLLMASLVGCASVNSVSLTPIPSKRSTPVRAEVSKVIFLGFNFDNDYIDPLVSDLKRQCPDGVVSGILTKDETISYFLVFKKRVVATGFCNSAAKTAGSKTQPRRPSSIEEAVETSSEN